MISVFFGTHLCAMTAVHDSLSFAKMAENIKVASNNLKALKNLRNDMNSLSNLIGNDTISNLLAGQGIDMKSLDSFNMEMESLVDADFLNEINQNRQRFRSQKNTKLLIEKNEASSKLHGIDISNSYNHEPHVIKPTRVKTQKQLDEVITTRQNYVVDASSLGRAVASQFKKEWSKRDLKALKKLKKETDVQTTLMGQITVTNKLLELISSQNNTTNLIFSQVLDVFSAIITSTSPIVFKKTHSGSGIKNPQQSRSSLSSSLSSSVLKLGG